MKIYCKDGYYSFKDLMKETYKIVYSDETKNGFSNEDGLVLTLFSLALDALCLEISNEIKKIEENNI